MLRARLGVQGIVGGTEDHGRHKGSWGAQRIVGGTKDHGRHRGVGGGPQG